jgi:hypothetical protein
MVNSYCLINCRNYDPALASGDIEGNGLDDIIVSGTGDIPANILLHQPDGELLPNRYR